MKAEASSSHTRNTTKARQADRQRQRERERESYSEAPDVLQWKSEGTEIIEKTSRMTS